MYSLINLCHNSNLSTRKKGIHMNINYTNKTQKSIIINEIKIAEGLPFQKLLPAEMFENILSEIPYRDRVYSPLLRYHVYYHKLWMMINLCKLLYHD